MSRNKREIPLTTSVAQTELQQRILATMRIRHVVTAINYDAEGRKKDGTRRASKIGQQSGYGSNAAERLIRLLAVRYHPQQVAGQVRQLERRGILHTTPGRNLQGQPWGWQSIALAVQPEDLRVEQWAIDELDKAITERMAKATDKGEGAGDRKVVVVQQHLAPHPTAPHPTPSGVEANINDYLFRLQQLPPDDLEQLADRLLVALARKLAEPPVERVVEKVTKPDETKAQALTRRIEALSARVNVADKNLATMEKRVNELGVENEMLKDAARAYQSRGGRLSSTIQNILKPEEREALDRLSRQRPNEGGDR